MVELIWNVFGFTSIFTGGKVRAQNTRPFNLKYAPHFGMFRHHAGEDPVDQLKFIADQGFRALEDNGLMDRTVELQTKIAAEMTRLNLEMGVFG